MISSIVSKVRPVMEVSSRRHCWASWVARSLPLLQYHKLKALQRPLDESCPSSALKPPPHNFYYTLGFQSPNTKDEM